MNDFFDVDGGMTELSMIRLIAQHTNDAFLVTEAEPVAEPGPRILYVNPAFTRMTGYTLEEVKGKTPRLLQTEDTDRAELDRIRDALAKWEPVRATLKNARKDGSTFWIELDIVPVADSQGWFHYWVAIQRDVTERVAYERDLIEAKHTAQAADRAKSQFLANMSHELRTPLNAVIGYSDFLKSHLPGPLNNAQDEYLGHIHSSGTHVLDLISDILDLAKIESGRLELHPEPWTSTHFAESLRSVVEPIARGGGVSLEWTVEPAELMVDRLRLRQSAINIISNAVKFSSEHDTVFIQIRPEGDKLITTITDRGPGMTETEAKAALEPFVQLPGDAAKEAAGTGLGLSITAKLMAKQSGDLVIRSTKGQGTAVDLVIPLASPVTSPID